MEKEDEKEIEEKWRQANEYNEMLFQAKGGIVEETEEKKYEELLNIHGTDIMGSLEIPKIQVELQYITELRMKFYLMESDIWKVQVFR